jgi:hypothetical protein
LVEYLGASYRVSERHACKIAGGGWEELVLLVFSLLSSKRRQHIELARRSKWNRSPSLLRSRKKRGGGI